MTTRSWEAYARISPQDDTYFTREPIQRERILTTARRCKGSVLDVGGGEGHLCLELDNAVMCDVSATRVERARARGVRAYQGDAYCLDAADQTYDTVVLGEVLEHLDDPGRALAEAFRVARERVVVSVPLDGWTDPTHEWRVSLDVLEDAAQHRDDPTRGRMIVLTFQRGKCWPVGYHEADDSWQEQFV